MTTADWIGLVTLGLTAVIAIAAVAATIAAYLSTKATEKSSEAQLVVRFLEEYASAEMDEALRTLRSFKDQHGAVFTGVTLEVRQLDTAVNAARRKVHYYFKKAYRLHKRGMLPRESLELVVGVNGHAMLYEIVEPLSRAIAPPGTDPARLEWFNDLKELCPPPTFDG